ncbi:hypothetical protein VTK73DRAFT_3189 [Phialemonium thermophilum]|uniref:Glucose-methanol-choline oxidoreductase C-terminal domain-containing protein n=1 Tax=Phialemonium thermophilum TaxID=223376 RepID=A0ABR3VKQ2_9PEZI
MLEVPRKHSVHQLETVWGAVWHLFLYFVFGTGLFANTVTPAAAFLRTTALDDDTMTIRRGAEGETGPDASAPRNVPDIEIMMTPLKCIRELVTSRPLMTFHTTLLQPFSRGRIELASTDPEASPRIHYRMLTDERDRATIRRGTRFAMRLAEQLQASGYPYPARLAFAPGVDAPELDAMTRDQDSPPLEGPSAP